MPKYLVGVSYNPDAETENIVRAKRAIRPYAPTAEEFKCRTAYFDYAVPEHFDVVYPERSRRAQHKRSRWAVTNRHPMAFSTTEFFGKIMSFELTITFGLATQNSHFFFKQLEMHLKPDIYNYLYPLADVDRDFNNLPLFQNTSNLKHIKLSKEQFHPHKCHKLKF
ncbi:MAG: hypothetical protein QQW96_20615 [Tychonema bourrellyi B0820]|uniref:Uncharacterized protein n=1 Tax=Tychonema bourrellyi FEM_GT703 TaxID=2040638 RepID=A0A2G4EYS0_9CYAN|nr:hypothetical protein [Tychonema bourrellyi B0820]PHX54636.1 hypothetical protein CP500_015045 [Tychonema bourrellyi FEM_GT703]